MKLKKLALGLATALVLSSFAACAGDSQKLAFNDYWELNSLTTSSSINETLEYKVTHEKGSGLDAINYTLTYGVGSYVTNLKTDIQGYIYTTTLTMPVTFQYGDEVESVTDTVTTEVIFARSKDGLRPISSKKNVVSHTPQNVGASSLKTCYSLYDFSVVTTYPEEGKATSIATYQQAEGEPIELASTFTASDKNYSYLDNEQLLLALRAISPSVSSGSVKIYNPFVESKQKINFSFSEETGAKFSYTFNGEPTEKDITYRPVSLTIDDRNPGGTQTAWIAKRGTADNNVDRNVMLKLTVPLSYSFGYLVYDLVSIAR